MGFIVLGILVSMFMLIIVKEEEKFIYRFFEKGEGDFKILYVIFEKVVKSKCFVFKLEKCNYGGCFFLIVIDVSLVLFILCVFYDYYLLLSYFYCYMKLIVIKF